MSATVYRESCGTYFGLRLHQVNGEEICSECQRGEDYRRLEHEGIPRRPQPSGPLAPITPEEGERNRALLAAALRSMDKNRGAA